MGYGIDRVGSAFVPGGFEGNEHTVAQGETLESIADQHGITVDSLLQSNPGIKGMDALQAGQTLQIPIISQTAEPDASVDVVEPFRTDAFTTATGSFFQKLSPLTIFDSREFFLGRQNFHIADQRVTIRHDGLTDFFRLFFTRISDAFAAKSPGEAMAWKLSPGEAVAWKQSPGEAVAWKQSPGEAVAWKLSPGEAVARRPGAAEAIARSEFGEDEESQIALPDFDLGVYVSMPVDEARSKKAGLFLSPNQFELDQSGGVIVNDRQFSELIQTTFESRPETDLQSINFAAFEKQKL